MMELERSIVGLVLRGEDSDDEEVLHIAACRCGIQVFGEKDNDPAYTIPWDVVGELLVAMATNSDNEEEYE